MAAVARAGPHRRVKNDELIAHYARAGDESLGVIQIRQLAWVVVALPTPMHPTNKARPPAASDEDLKESPRRGGTGEHRQSTKRPFASDGCRESPSRIGETGTFSVV